MTSHASPADAIFNALRITYLADEDSPALDHLARALMDADAEESDAVGVGSEAVDVRPEIFARDIFRAAYGATKYDAREVFSQSWFAYLSAPRLRRLAFALCAQDTLSITLLRAAASAY